MSTKSVPVRQEIPSEHTWDTASIYATTDAWEAEFTRLGDELPSLGRFRGCLGNTPATLAEWFEASEAYQRRLASLAVYASMNQAVDANDQAAAARNDRARGLSARAGGAMAFAEPELLQIGVDKLRDWVRLEPRLALYEHYFDRLAKRAPHVRSAEVEELLSQATDPFLTSAATHSILANAELRFAPAREIGRAHV